MKKFIRDYLKVIAMAITGLVFVLASFYLMINYNHNEELKKTIYIGSNEVNYVKHKEILNDLNTNLNRFNIKRNTSSAYKQIANSLAECYSVLQSKESFTSIETNKEYSAYEIYKLGSNFQNNVINVCWNRSFEFLKNNNNESSGYNISMPTNIKNMTPILDNYVSAINSNLSDSLKEIENNSSYFYTTNITSATVRNYLGSSYQTIVKSYNDFASILLELSRVINEDEVVLNG